MYTPEELKAIREAERKHDMKYDSKGRARVTAARNDFAEHRARLAAERAARNSDLAARLEAGKQQTAAVTAEPTKEQQEHRERMARYARLLVESEALLALCRAPRVVIRSDEPAPF